MPANANKDHYFAYSSGGQTLPSDGFIEHRLEQAAFNKKVNFLNKDSGVLNSGHLGMNMPPKFKPVYTDFKTRVCQMSSVHCLLLRYIVTGFFCLTKNRVFSSYATPLLSEMRSLLGVVCVLLQLVNFSHNVGFS